MGLLEYLPIIIFFIVFKLTDIYLATGALMAASAALLAVLKLLGKNISKQQWWLFAAIVVFGGLTLAFRDPLFLKWKVTLVYAAFALILVTGVLTGRNPVKAILGKEMTLPAPLWNKLAWGWAGYFCAMAVLNLYIAYNYSQDLWVDFKLFGTVGLGLIAAVITGMVIYKHLPDDEKDPS
ncbi:septation protein A [Gallaecimonas sp. GXIMD1310]|uniref:septation protein A n=1 Tax=Gallaecimonas sp. GXIMD1310 TaxID=3131926 RepID=UPI003245D6BB